MKGMKILKFKKGIWRINFPFMLTNFSPWQEQVSEQRAKLQKAYKVRKSAHWGYEITETGANIVLYKN